MGLVLWRPWERVHPFIFLSIWRPPASLGLWSLQCPAFIFKFPALSHLLCPSHKERWLQGLTWKESPDNLSHFNILNHTCNVPFATLRSHSQVLEIRTQTFWGKEGITLAQPESEYLRLCNHSLYHIFFFVLFICLQSFKDVKSHS